MSANGYAVYPLLTQWQLFHVGYLLIFRARNLRISSLGQK